jgi:hypothetical protein
MKDERGKMKEERGKMKEERGKRKDEGGKMKDEEERGKRKVRRRGEGRGEKHTLLQAQWTSTLSPLIFINSHILHASKCLCRFTNLSISTCGPIFLYLIFNYFIFTKNKLNNMEKEGERIIIFYEANK